jgi:CDP-glucose 4,6-dehydratase
MEALDMIDAAFWRGRRVLVTGHTGFKGGWLATWLADLGAEVVGLALPPAGDFGLFERAGIEAACRSTIADLRDADRVRAVVAAASPEVVLHLAAQPLVSVGYAQPGRTFEVNVMGTARVLEWVSGLEGVIATIVITTDKVYDPAYPAPHDESHPLGGREPYSASKAAAEIVVAGWPPTSSPRATARAGNVIGGGDWAQDRLLPDLVRAWSAGVAPVLRRPEGVRPWQHVLEPLRGYLLYAEALGRGSDLPRGLNFGPADMQAVSVAALVEFAAGEWQRLGGTLPEPAWTVSSATHFEETGVLTLDSSLAAERLGWVSVLDWKAAVTLTLEWYNAALHGAPAADLVHRQLAAYASTVEGER